MISTSTLCKSILNVKDIVVENTELFVDAQGVKHLRIYARPKKSQQFRCPFCGRRCAGYDHMNTHREWRSLDFAGIIVTICAYSPRICCPEHGIVTADVPWAFHHSYFTKSFEYTAAWMTEQTSKSAVSQYMRVTWDTVGRIISRVRNKIEPDPHRRLDHLEQIGIDETSYRKGHRYITVVVNHANNNVVWVHKGFGKTVLTEFMKSLTQEQRESIKVVTGDGARWITECVHQYLPNCTRCIDSFHVVSWAMEALDTVRRQSWRTALKEVFNEYGTHKRHHGRPRKAEQQTAEAKARENAKVIKGAAYVLGKSPEHLTETQTEKLEIIQLSDNKLYRAYQLKEKLRLLLKMTDVEKAEIELHDWVMWARRCRIPEFVELQRKIMRHKDQILNTIRMRISNARVESINNKIKLIIRRSFGFRNIENMMDLILLICSDLKIQLPNRPQEQYA